MAEGDRGCHRHPGRTYAYADQHADSLTAFPHLHRDPFSFANTAAAYLHRDPFSLGNTAAAQPDAPALRDTHPSTTDGYPLPVPVSARGSCPG